LTNLTIFLEQHVVPEHGDRRVVVGKLEKGVNEELEMEPASSDGSES
jgi:hypothetical protein